MKAMPGLTEKLVLAAVILSCGLVAHSDQSDQDHKGKPAVTGTTHTRQVSPGASNAGHFARLAKAVAARTNMP